MSKKIWMGSTKCDICGEELTKTLIDELTAHIEDVFGCNEEPPTATDINDYVWVESENIYKVLGLNENGELPRSEK